MPFSFHWKTGVVPPFTGVAVNVTFVPAQIFVDDAAMFTEGVSCEATFIITLLDVTVLMVAQVALLVNTQVTTSLFAKDAFV
jgi:hypothetical protein